jgi:hypothetical protein
MMPPFALNGNGLGRVPAAPGMAPGGAEASCGADQRLPQLGSTVYKRSVPARVARFERRKCSETLQESFETARKPSGPNAGARRPARTAGTGSLRGGSPIVQMGPAAITLGVANAMASAAHDATAAQAAKHGAASAGEPQAYRPIDGAAGPALTHPTPFAGRAVSWARSRCRPTNFKA